MINDSLLNQYIMKDTRRDFIKKSALAAVLPVTGLESTVASFREHTKRVRPYIKDAGIKFAFAMDPKSPKVPFAKQLAVNYAVSGLIKVTDLKPWDPEVIKATKEAWDNLGIKWIVVEGPPALGSQTKLGLKGRDEEIDHFISFMKNLKQYGDVDIICYNWMPVISWARTNKFRPGRGGALVMDFDYELVKNAPLTDYGEVSKETLWKNLEYFIKAVMPEADKIGMRLSMHPDDPQVDVIQGISRIMNSIENFDRLLSMHKSKANGVTMCQGNFGLMGIEIPSLVRRWGKDIINFVHFRNIQDLSGTVPSIKFTETFHDEGQIDMYEAMKAYYDIGFDGPMRPDHVPTMATEVEAGQSGGYTTLGNLFAIGYMRGLAESVVKEDV
jgi:mannonate dehydratase